MLYLIGLGLNEKNISQQGLEAVGKCSKIYLDGYTIQLPYTLNVLEKIIGKRVFPVERDFVESMDKLLEEAKKENVALLVYGSPLTATTHIALVHEAKEKKVKCEMIFNASIIDAIGETGLQLYKFGKISSMPTWQKEKHYQPDSFMEIVKENRFINAHSLILIDIGLELRKALFQLEVSAGKHDFRLEKIVVCSRLGTKDKKILYGTLAELKDRLSQVRSNSSESRIKEIKGPYCLIIPGKLHFFEEEILKNFS